jgi:adenylyltransferase/sulfurtransferase
VTVVPIHDRLTAKNALDVVKAFDVIIDGTDNFPSKFLINDTAVLANKPLIHGGILRFTGQVLTIIPGKSACYRCLFKTPPPAGLVPSCQEAGVLGALAGFIGTIQATEALKLILGVGQPLTDRLLTYDALTTRFRNVPLRRNPKCPVCGEHPTITEPVEYEQEVCRTA